LTKYFVLSLTFSKTVADPNEVPLNIVRSNDPAIKNDFWLSMREVHLDIVNENEKSD